MSNAGSALMGIGSARGENRSVEAAEMAVSSPLLEASIDGAHGVLLSIAGGSDLGLFEINEAAALVADAVHQEANIIFGATIDDALGDEVRVTVIAAGFDGGMPKRREGASALGSVQGRSTSSQSANNGETAAVATAVATRRAEEAEEAPAKPAAAPAKPAAPATPPPATPPAEPAPVAKKPAPSVQFSDDELDVPDFLK